MEELFLDAEQRKEVGRAKVKDLEAPRNVVADGGILKV